MSAHIPYPSIEQFRTAIHKVTAKTRQTGVDSNGDPVFDHVKTLPTLTYEGTVKLHGTNAAWCVDFKNGREVWFQSRENVITVDKDNAGFARQFNDKKEQIVNMAYEACRGFNDAVVTIFGEWCGGNIQPNVGLSKLSKRFVIFGINVGGDWLPREIVSKIKNHSIGVYNIYDYPTWQVNIDFNKPELAQNEIVKITEEIEAHCPVSYAFGVDGIGEGAVFQCISDGWQDPEFAFKSKGVLHSASKVKTIAAIDVELVASYREFAEKTVTENRCRQGIDKLREAGKKLDRTSVGDFIKWVVADVEKEESDTAIASGLDMKKLGGELTKAARAWFFKNEFNF